MNLYKFNFDLAGSSNALKTITIPSDSKYSMGLKFFNGNEELILGDDVQITIQDDKYIYTPTEIFNNYAVFAGSTHNGTKTYRVNFHKDGDPAVDVNFKGITVRTNDSKISNWAVTDSQMKIVYTDEWEIMKDTADDRVIYFVVDRPTPPQPIPPKPVPPTPGGDGEWGMYMEDVSEDQTFDPTNVDDCLALGQFGTMFKYTRDGVDCYLGTGIMSTGSEVIGDEAKVDQIAIMLTNENNKVFVDLHTYKDNMYLFSRIEKSFDSNEEAEEYVNNYFIERFGEGFDQPNTSTTNLLPADFDTWEINEEYTIEIPITSETDDYVYVEDEEGTFKLFKHIPTYPQWTSATPR